MNYHLMIDHFFIDPFIDNIDRASPNNNTFIFTFNLPSKYVKSEKGIIAPYGSVVLKNIVKKISKNDRVFIHWFENDVMQVVDELDSKVPIYMIFWGGDFLSQAKIFDDFNNDVRTKKLVKRNERKKFFYWTRNPIKYLHMIPDYLHYIKKKKKEQKEAFGIRKKFLRRLNYFCHWNELDFEIIKHVYDCSPTFITFFGGLGLEKISVPLKNTNSCTSIWLGNSDTNTNNHLDAIYFLKKYKDNGIKIICPLSYGVDRPYGDYVDNEGRNIFADNWVAIRSFMAYEKYINLFESVNVVVMYHNRTQASGNVIVFIKKGIKVFLKKQSSLFQFLVNNGITVFDSNTIKNLAFEEFIEPLTAVQTKTNIEIISNLFSEKKQRECYNEILN